MNLKWKCSIVVSSGEKLADKINTFILDVSIEFCSSPAAEWKWNPHFSSVESSSSSSTFVESFFVDIVDLLVCFVILLNLFTFQHSSSDGSCWQTKEGTLLEQMIWMIKLSIDSHCFKCLRRLAISYFFLPSVNQAELSIPWRELKKKNNSCVFEWCFTLETYVNN